MPLEDKIGGFVARQSEVIVAGIFVVELDAKYSSANSPTDTRLV
jgi:hypothetical protein